MIFPSRKSRNTATKVFICPPTRNGAEGCGQGSDPFYFQRYAVLVCHLLRYLIDLAGHNPFAVFRPLQGFGQVAPLAGGHYPVGELIKDHVGSKKTAKFFSRHALRWPASISVRPLKLPAGPPILASTNGGSLQLVHFVSPARSSLVS